MSIKGKVISLVLVTFAITISMSGWLIFSQQEKWIESQAKNYGEKKGEELRALIISLMENHSYKKERDKILNAYSLKNEIVAVDVFPSPALDITSHSKKQLGGFEKRVFGANKPIGRSADYGETEVYQTLVPVIGQAGNCVESCHFAEPGLVMGGVEILVNKDFFGREVRQENKDTIMISVGMVAFLVLLITGMLTRLIDRPIKDVIRGARQIAAGRFAEVSFDRRVSNEFAPLYEAFAAMQNSLFDVANNAKVISEGDLTKKIKGDNDLAVSFNSMVDKLGDLVKEIRQSSNSLGGGLDSISRVASDNSAGMEKQIKELQQLEVTMKELAQSSLKSSNESDKVFESAQMSLNTAQKGRAAASRGKEAMVKINEGMKDVAYKTVELKQRTDQIQKVLEMITEIALETKILSVNASIEASRAGEAGKGFGVVAEEIGKLTENVVQAVGNITTVNEEIQRFSSNLAADLINQRKLVKNGVAVMGELDSGLEEILSSVGGTASEARTISSSSREQNRKSEEVNEKMRGIASLASRLGQSSKQSLGEVEKIRGIFGELSTRVSQFKVLGMPEETPAEMTEAAAADIADDVKDDLLSDAGSAEEEGFDDILGEGAEPEEADDHLEEKTQRINRDIVEDLTEGPDDDDGDLFGSNQGEDIFDELTLEEEPDDNPDGDKEK